MATKSESRKKLVSGCGTILKENRLKGGYRLVKRKKPIGASATEEVATAKRRGRKKKVTASAPVTAPAKRRGRPAKAKATAMKPSVKAVSKKRAGKRRGRPAKA